MKIKFLSMLLFSVVLTMCFGVTNHVAATTVEELMAQIAALQAQLQSMQNQQSNTSEWCHLFTKNLGYSDSGSAEVGFLHTALTKENILYADDTGNEYGEPTMAAVIEFQAKYGIKQTGYVGVITRTKLNSLYECGVVQPVCSPNWQCTWGSCVNGYQSQVATDLNNCGVTTGNNIACTALARECTTTTNLWPIELGFNVVSGSSNNSSQTVIINATFDGTKYDPIGVNLNISCPTGVTANFSTSPAGSVCNTKFAMTHISDGLYNITLSLGNTTSTTQLVKMWAEAHVNNQVVGSSNSSTSGSNNFGVTLGTNGATTLGSGVCGDAAKTYSWSSTAFTGSFCSTGTASPASPTFPRRGYNTSWTCLGINGGTNATCSALHPYYTCDYDASNYMGTSRLLTEAGIVSSKVSSATVLSIGLFDGPGGSFITTCPADTSYDKCVTNQNDGGACGVVIGVDCINDNCTGSATQTSIKITSPIAETTLTNKSITVSGTCSGYSGSVDVYYYSDNRIDKQINCTNGIWSTPITINSNAASGSFDLYAQAMGDASLFDKIKLYFNWSTQSSITVISPNGGESWVKGQSHTITWHGINYPSNGYVALFLQSSSGNSIGVIKNVFFSSGNSIASESYSWDTNTLTSIGQDSNGIAYPTDFSTGSYKIRASIIDYAASYGSMASMDESNNYFTITSASATTCTSFTYSAWSSCSSAGNQTRTVTSSYPAGCVGNSSAELSQNCTPNVQPSITVLTPTAGTVFSNPTTMIPFSFSFTGYSSSSVFFASLVDQNGNQIYGLDAPLVFATSSVVNGIIPAPANLSIPAGSAQYRFKVCPSYTATTNCALGSYFTISTTSTTVINGVCGTAKDATYSQTATAFAGTLCSTGIASPVSPTFPGRGSSVTWTCQGSNGGANASCTVRHPFYSCDYNASNYTGTSRLLTEAKIISSQVSSATVLSIGLFDGPGGSSITTCPTDTSYDKCVTNRNDGGACRVVIGVDCIDDNCMGPISSNSVNTTADISSALSRIIEQLKSLMKK